MKSLKKRIWPNIRKHFGRNLSLFILIVVMVAPVSGFLVAADSVAVKNHELMREGCVEDGQFTTAFPIEKSCKKELKKEGLKLENLYYIEAKVKKNKVLRIYKNRESINKLIIYKGRKARGNKEIVINRIFGKNNRINIGDKIKIPKKYFKNEKSRKLKVVGFASTPDYNSCFSKNSDLMFDAVNFGVAFVSQTLQNEFVPSKLHCQTSYRFKDRDLSHKRVKDKNENIIDIVSNRAILTNSMDKANNNGITFMMNDMGGDKPMMLVMMGIMLAVIALLFVAISSSTIHEECEIIGTLLAGGYRRREIIAFYISIPVIITLLAVITGNAFGYTIMVEPMKDMYYKSFELPPFKGLFNTNAFILTSIIPFAIMLIINLTSLIKKFRFSPLQFMRGELRKPKKSRAVKLPFKNFEKRFAMRVFLRNKGDFAIMVVGIFISTLILFYGFSIEPTFDNYTKQTSEGLVSKYQYILKGPVKLSKPKKHAEKFTVTTVEAYIPVRGEREDISLIGIGEKTTYFKDLKLPAKKNEIVISENFSKKAGLSVGDKVTLWDKFRNKKSDYRIVGTYAYPVMLSAFISRENLNKYLNEKKFFFNGYYSDKKLDIDDKFIATVVDKEAAYDLGKQLKDILGHLMFILSGLAIIFFFTVMYMLTKIIIKRNSLHIAYLKIFGYTDKEIKKIYLKNVTVTLLLTLILGLPLEIKSLYYLSFLAMAKFSGYFEMTLTSKTIIWSFIIPIVIYALVSFIQLRKISKMNFGEALKNRE